MPPSSPEIDGGIRDEFRDEIDAGNDAENGTGIGDGFGFALRKSRAGVRTVRPVPRRGRAGPGGGGVIAQGAGRVRDREDGSVT
ncbi:hypothetical protein [Streptomyces sp. S186]|uniref:hypothetical protein n=1 Tax=Streptomyces sp. S186 TaxID=3434395 RepID=UPI003F660E19